MVSELGVRRLCFTSIVLIFLSAMAALSSDRHAKAASIQTTPPTSAPTLRPTIDPRAFSMADASLYSTDTFSLMLPPFWVTYPYAPNLPVYDFCLQQGHACSNTGFQLSFGSSSELDLVPGSTSDESPAQILAEFETAELNNPVNTGVTFGVTLDTNLGLWSGAGLEEQIPPKDTTSATHIQLRLVKLTPTQWIYAHLEGTDQVWPQAKTIFGCIMDTLTITIPGLASPTPGDRPTAQATLEVGSIDICHNRGTK